MTDQTFTYPDLPPTFREPSHKITPRYSHHARQEARYDKYGLIRLPSIIDLSEFKVFEVTYRDGRLHKIGIRGAYTPGYNIAFILVRDKRGWFCKTVWLNEESDRPIR